MDETRSNVVFFLNTLNERRKAFDRSIEWSVMERAVYIYAYVFFSTRSRD